MDSYPSAETMQTRHLRSHAHRIYCRSVACTAYYMYIHVPCRVMLSHVVVVMSLLVSSRSEVRCSARLSDRVGRESAGCFC
jgi:hypothetical protein